MAFRRPKRRPLSWLALVTKCSPPAQLEGLLWLHFYALPDASSVYLRRLISRLGCFGRERGEAGSHSAESPRDHPY